MKRIFKIIIFLLVVGIIGVAVLFTYLDSFYWDKKSSMESPDGKFNIHEYNYMSDGDRHAPYGKYLFLQKSLSPIPGYKSYVIFAGYCDNSFNFSWVSNNQININCKTNEPDSIRTYSNKAFGVRINVTL